MTEIPEDLAPNIRGRSWAAGASLAEVQPGCEGVIFAQGSRFGGHSLFVQDGKLIYLYNFLGIDQYRFECEMPTGRVNIGVVFTKEREEPKFVPNGTLELRVNKKVVASGPMRTQPGKFSIAGEGFNVGEEGGDPVSPTYRPPFAFRGGKIEFVTFDLSGKPVIDLERE